MSKLFLILVVVGLAVAGWLHREEITDWLSAKSTEVTRLSESIKPPGTPHPAAEAVAEAKKIYPALARAGTAFNLRFVALYNEAKASKPNLLAQPGWPMQLAERTARELGVATMPHSTTAAISGWTDDYAAAVEAARNEHKKLILDFTGSDWCEYCMALDREVLNTTKFLSWARDRVVLVRVDFPQNFPQSTRLKEQNSNLKKKYPFTSYPTILVVDPAGNVLGKSGYNPNGGPDRFIAVMESMIRG
jgi:thioredoxin-related protein